MPLYGPPPDPTQVLVAVGPSDEPGAWALSLGVGVALLLLALVRRLPDALRALAVCVGGSVALTAPALGMVNRAVWGSWPTIDKTGSLLFFLDGVHVRMALHPLQAPNDPAARLIGVHIGHLWLTALLDVFEAPFAAFNAHGLLNVALGWWAAALFIRELRGRWDTALVAGFPFGLGLHVFRDLNWYTIEKSGVVWLALFAWALVRAWRGARGGALLAAAIYVLSAWMNWYLALVGAAGTAVLVVLALVHDRRAAGTTALLRVSLACSLAVAPLAGLQLALLHGQGTLGDPALFLNERAALDNLSIWPPLWNRLELWRALNLPLVALALWTLATERGLARALGLTALALAVVSTGPSLLPGVPNPVYLLLFKLVPGFWRVAKPEVFFEGSYLLLLALGAWGLERVARGRRVLWALPILALGWILVVRTHPVYPPMSRFTPVKLAPGWERSLPGAAAPGGAPQEAP